MSTAVLPELDLAKLRRYCAARVPRRLQQQVRLEVSVKGKRVSIHERRPVFDGVDGEWSARPIAEVRYAGAGLWNLYFDDRHGGWKLYFGLEPRQRIDVIIEEVEADPSCVFWG